MAKEANGSGFEQVYEQLRKLARDKLAKGLSGQSLQATGLVHEVWIKMAEGEGSAKGPEHLYAMAAQAMRWVMVDRARKRGAVKRAHKVEWTDPDQFGTTSPEDPGDQQILDLDRSLARLESLDARKAQVVLLRYFGGLSVEETAGSLGISKATVKREWQFARAWLSADMLPDSMGPGGAAGTAGGVSQEGPRNASGDLARESE